MTLVKTSLVAAGVKASMLEAGVSPTMNCVFAALVLAERLSEVLPPSCLIEVVRGELQIEGSKEPHWWVEVRQPGQRPILADVTADQFNRFMIDTRPFSPVTVCQITSPPCSRYSRVPSILPFPVKRGAAGQKAVAQELLRLTAEDCRAAGNEPAWARASTWARDQIGRARERGR